MLTNCGRDYSQKLWEPRTWDTIKKKKEEEKQTGISLKVFYCPLWKEENQITFWTISSPFHLFAA